MASVEEFDPNRDFRVNPWMVYDGNVRLYKSRGPALNALLGSHGPAKLCEFVNGQWATHAYKPKRLMDFDERACDVCADRPLEAAHSYRYQYKRAPNAGPLYAHGHWAWRREHGKITNPPELLFVCYACKQRVS